MALLRNWAREVLLMGRGLLALACGCYVDALIKSDAEKYSQTPDQARNNVNLRLRALRQSVYSSLIILASAVLVAIAAPINITPQGRVWIGAASIFCFAWATLAKLGWHVGSFAGDTVVERLDLHIFRFLYWLGTLLGTLALV
jgi:hypothetical protein